jgi:hypothetical protein
MFGIMSFFVITSLSLSSLQTVIIMYHHMLRHTYGKYSTCAGPAGNYVYSSMVCRRRAQTPTRRFLPGAKSPARIARPQRRDYGVPGDSCRACRCCGTLQLYAGGVQSQTYLRNGTSATNIKTMERMVGVGYRVRILNSKV